MTWSRLLGPDYRSIRPPSEASVLALICNHDAEQFEGTDREIPTMSCSLDIGLQLRTPPYCSLWGQELYKAEQWMGWRGTHLTESDH